jgi:hypothetical protein
MTEWASRASILLEMTRAVELQRTEETKVGQFGGRSRRTVGHCRAVRKSLVLWNIIGAALREVAGVASSAADRRQSCS